MRVPLWVVAVVVLVLAGAMILLRAIPYGLILPLIVGWLAGVFAMSPSATGRAKQCVTVATVWATAACLLGGLMAVPAQLTLVATGAYVLLHQDVTGTRG